MVHRPFAVPQCLKPGARHACRRANPDTDSSATPSATAAAILGQPVAKGAKSSKPNGAVKVKAEWATFYNNLLALREQLLKQMSGLAKESGPASKNAHQHQKSLLQTRLPSTVSICIRLGKFS